VVSVRLTGPCDLYISHAHTRHRGQRDLLMEAVKSAYAFSRPYTLQCVAILRVAWQRMAYGVLRIYSSPISSCRSGPLDVGAVRYTESGKSYSLGVSAVVYFRDMISVELRLGGDNCCSL
jgi:hypothetical protein